MNILYKYLGLGIELKNLDSYLKQYIPTGSHK